MYCNFDECLNCIYPTKDTIRIIIPYILEMYVCVCHASKYLIPRYEWLPAFDDSHRTPNWKRFTNASLTATAGAPER